MERVRVSYDEMQKEFTRILLKHNFTLEKAEKCARIFATNSLEGIYSHGVYRFPRFVDYIQKGFVTPDAEPEKVSGLGAIEQWNGNLGPGPLNAEFCTKRAMELASENGMGCVAIANTNHWMRGGTYGWQAARKGYVFIGWTNTEGNMPAWGAQDSRLGNNPLVIAMPFGDEAIVLDFAMTQFSYGKIEAAKIEGNMLPFPGGFNTKHELTQSPDEILETKRGLPIGYWKGAGLSLLLDILATVLSAGLATKDVSGKEAEYGVSQVFICIDLKKLHNYPAIDQTISGIIDDFKASLPIDENHDIRYPGERVIAARTENLKHGIPVEKSVWEEILRMR
ncbi:3-dehydro-L-gulonate 2-dehydrogenase [Maribellus sp. YY47]|uniref:3-dehydro-L-gulonate 2-dehydrogenase n=1 Tax=Maribellus sp. YY47 TaxID=2929486 RepID=UPI0020018DA6|nr:3-dehydro-L-gulonate 2-dehydrogenase [Maribellus sp. YY47]MCK3682519.1 3-dehydro-L-gulonate 2-dehydrogenase [Maribellus sp. YY47]